MKDSILYNKYKYHYLGKSTVQCVPGIPYFRIGEFLNSLNVGFRMLNLKNDMLRKKFDSIKYDLKKVEEVVYDLSIRGLNKPTSTPSTGPPLTTGPSAEQTSS